MKLRFLLVLILSTSALCLPLTSKQKQEHPRMRVGTLPFPFFIYTVSKEKLGNHSYIKQKREYKRLRKNRRRALPIKNKETDRGMMYTCNGGFIDIAHLRAGADYTAYLHSKFSQAYKEKSNSISITGQDPSIFKVSINYPKYLNELETNELEEEISRLSILSAQYLAHIILTWHEATTWYGWSAMKIKNAEKMSGFSYEDIYSHMLGIELAGKALGDSENSYDNSMTTQLNKLLDFENSELIRVSNKVTKRVTKEVKGDWYYKTGWFKYYLKKYTNIGLEGKDVRPLLVAEVPECQNVAPKSIEVFGMKEFQIDESSKLADMLDVNLTPKINITDTMLKQAGAVNGTINVRRNYPILMENVNRSIIEYHDSAALIQY